MTGETKIPTIPYLCFRRKINTTAALRGIGRGPVFIPVSFAPGWLWTLAGAKHDLVDHSRTHARSLTGGGAEKVVLH